MLRLLAAKVTVDWKGPKAALQGRPGDWPRISLENAATARGSKIVEGCAGSEKKTGKRGRHQPSIPSGKQLSGLAIC